MLAGHLRTGFPSYDVACAESCELHALDGDLHSVQLCLWIGTCVALLTVACTLAVDAVAAREPTPSGRAGVTLAVIQGIPHVDGFAAIFVVRRVVMSTVKPGPSSSFSSFAAAFGIAKDQSGLYAPGPRTALVGLHRRTQNWITIGYGVNRAIRREPQSFFGGRRAAILRDLGIRCS